MNNDQEQQCTEKGLTNTVHVNNIRELDMKYQDISLKEIEEERLDNVAFLRDWYRQDVDWTDRLGFLFTNKEF